MILSHTQLYTGPDQLLPVASILAAAAGLLFIFWGKISGVLRRLAGKSKPPDARPKSSGASNHRSTSQR
jgi:hypothetical protein